MVSLLFYLSVSAVRSSRRTVTCNWHWMVLSAQKIIFQKIEHDVNKDIIKMDVMLVNRTNGSPVVNVDAVLFHDLAEPIFVSSGTATVGTNDSPTRYCHSHFSVPVGRWTISFRSDWRRRIINRWLKVVASICAIFWRSRTVNHSWKC